MTYILTQQDLNKTYGCFYCNKEATHYTDTKSQGRLFLCQGHTYLYTRIGRNIKEIKQSDKDFWIKKSKFERIRDILRNL